MTRRARNIAYLTLIVLVLVTPTAIMLTSYQVTKNPYLRPLSITLEALRSYSVTGDAYEIVVDIDWVPSASGGFSKQQLSQALERAFAAKGVAARIRFFAGDGAYTTITYQVGSTRLGPYPTARAAEGVSMAVEAYRMTQ